MTENEALELQKKLYAFQELSHTIQKREKLLSILDAFLNDGEHGVEYVVINPDRGTVQYVNKTSDEQFRLREICSMEPDFQNVFVEHFFKWAMTFIHNDIQVAKTEQEGL